jgi:hypothetical protein
MQTELFEVGPREKIPRPKILCTAGPIGSGPAGETCGSCRFKTYMGMTAGRYLKCELMRNAWTRGGGTDIKARWAACEKWEPKEG